MLKQKRTAEEFTSDYYEEVLEPMQETVNLLKTYEDDEHFVQPKGRGGGKVIKNMIKMLEEKVRLRAYWISQQSNERFVVGERRAVFRKRYRGNRKY